MKEYFSHDYNTRSDEKIKLLIRKFGMEGYGIYWSIVEDLYANANALRLDCDGIAYDLHSDKETIKSIINDFDLFYIDGEIFGSNSVKRRLEERNDKSKKASKSAAFRWNKQQEDANALRTGCERNAIKEKKRKEYNKENIIQKEKKRNVFLKPTIEEIQSYIKEKSYSVDANRFVDFYESKGWMVGKNKMADWKAAIRTWQAKEQNSNVGIVLKNNSPDKYKDGPLW